MSKMRDGESLALIPARGGSSGVRGKNVRPLGGVPLIVHSIRAAEAAGVFERVHVSTDDEVIAEIALAHGATVIARPPALALADSAMGPVVEHALEWCGREHGLRPRRIFLLQPTSPLRSGEDIRQAASLLDSGDCDAVMAVFEADDPPQWGLLSDPEGMLRPAFPWNQYLSRRQDLPPTYLDGPLYAIETDAFLAKLRFLTDRTRYFVLPRERAVDIDSEMDFLFAEFLLERARQRAVHSAL